LPVSSAEPAFEALDFGHDEELAFNHRWTLKTQMEEGIRI
jgi:hypothetical protein